MQDAVSEIKSKIDIVEFLSRYITLKKAGRNFKALCPFHQEKTPSFVISPERQIWRCFGTCGEGGDVIKFLMKLENITFYEALQELAVNTGVKLKDMPFEDKLWRKKERFISMNLLAAEYFNHILLNTTLGEKTRDYLKSRSIKTGTTKVFMLGYAPSSWDSLLKFLKKKKYDETELTEGGLIIKSDRGSYYDRFRGRLIFPIKDSRGNIIGFSGRSLDEKEKAAKYINTPETPLYRKRETLYGIDLAKEAIKKMKNVILVEGEFDVISPHQAGIENVVATKGTAVTHEQLKLVKRFTDRITLALDSDEAGSEAIKKAIEEGERLDLEIETVLMDWAHDPDEAVRTDLLKFQKLLKNTKPAYDFIIESAQKKYPDNNPFSKKQIGEEVLPLLEKIQNPIVQSHYIKKMAGILDVSEGTLQFMIRKMRQKKKQQSFAPSAQKDQEADRELNIQKYLLSLMFQNKDPDKIAETIFEIIEVADFTMPAFQKIVKAFFDFKKAHQGAFDFKNFFVNLPNEIQAVVDELYLYASLELGFEEANLEKLAYEIKKLSLKRQLARLLDVTELSASQKQELQKLSVSLKEVEKKATSL